MKEKLFSEDVERLLLSPEKWKLAAPFMPDEVETVPAGQVPERDKKQLGGHSHRELLVPLGGDYIYGFNEKFYHCVPGMIFFIDSGISHEALYTSCASRLTHMWFVVERDKLLGNYLMINNGRIEFCNRLKVLFRDFDPDVNIYEMWDAVKSGELDVRTFFGRRKLLFALNYLFLRLIEADAVQESDIGEYQREMIESSKAHIRKSFKRGVNIEQLARVAGYSKFHFLRLFKKYAGFTVYEYVNLCRVNEVELMLQDDCTQKEIAYELGFSSPAAFSNWRRKMQRQTVSEMPAVIRHR